MTENQREGTSVETALDRYLRSLDAGGSQNTLRWVLADGEKSFLAYLQDEGIEHVEAIDTDTIRNWGLTLRKRTTGDDEDEQISASTAHNYYAYTRAFLEFCLRDGLLESNPAKTEAAAEFLPEDTGDRDRQFWTDEARDGILRFVQRRVDEAYDNEDRDVATAYRDRALVTLLALTGVRGAEVFRDPNDDLRDGLTWADVDLERGTIRVLGKSREYERVGLFEQPQTALDRWQQVQEPPTDDWPVFPTGHYPSKRRALESELSDGRADTILEDQSIDEALRDHEVPSPSISKNGARKLMERLCHEADIDIDGEYLKPHGGRRGLGHRLYASGESELAQRALRHKSIRTTHEAYSDLQPAQVAEQVGEVIDGDGGE